MTPRAITGFGIASAIGVGHAAFFRGLADAATRSGKPPADRPPVQSFDAKSYAADGTLAQVLEVPNFDPAKYLGDKGLRTLDRLTKLQVVAARLAMHDSGFKKDGVYVQSSPDRVGLCCSNAYGSLEAITELDRVAKLEDARYINPAKFPNTVANSASGYVSIWEDLRALNVAVSDGNCGALDTVACADVYLETGRADAVLIGGAEAMSEALFLAFHKLGALAKNPCFDVYLGEGAALFSMEPVELAEARSAAILAEVVGYGTAFVAPESDAGLVLPSREAMERAITSALEDAKLRPSDVDICAASLSGLRAFDKHEQKAIDAVLGTDAPIVAPKGVIGETLGASGAMSMAAALGWLGGIAPSPMFRGNVPARIDTVLITSMGYYGNASAVILRRPR